MNESLKVDFERRFGRADGLLSAHAPGRVNLIGEHTDYNGGFVMPMAVDRGVTVVFRPRSEGPVRLWAASFDEADEFHLERIERSAERPWANYVRGVAAMLLEAGYRPHPIDAVIGGDLPIGAGLSSSAALEVAAAMALLAWAERRPEPKELALICQRAENQFVGVNCGIMDQFISVHARAEHALLLDCRSLDYELLPLDTGAVRVVVANTMVHHELGSSAYNERRAQCEQAARLLGVEQLRDATVQMVERNAGRLGEVVFRRARHVVTENDRTLWAAEALKSGDYALFGRLMDQSHRSLRDDYQVSCPELDLMVELARGLDGCLGARMVGAGFGGCTVNLVESPHADRFCERLRAAYRGETGIEPDVYQFRAVGGASVGPC